MKKISKILFVLILVSFTGTIATADRGSFGKKKNKIQLNIVTFNTLKKSIPFNLKSGLTFRGSNILNSEQVGNAFFNTTLISYKKGNTVYLLLYKQKVLIPEYSASTGSKLIIRRHK